MKAILLAIILLAGTVTPLKADEGLRYAAGFELGLEGETGRAWALSPRGLLQLDWNFLSFIVWAAASIPGGLADSASLSLVASAPAWGRLNFRAEALTQWRSYGSPGSELRLGLLLRCETSPHPGSIFFRAAAGFSMLQTTVPALALTFWDPDPLLCIGLGYPINSAWEVDFAISDFTGKDASLWLKTFFEFGLAWHPSHVRLSSRLILRYSDFFTLTGYLDGAALRCAALFPLDSKRGQ